MHSLFPQITVDTTAPLPGVVSDSLISPHALSLPTDHCRHDHPSTLGWCQTAWHHPMHSLFPQITVDTPPLYLRWCQTAWHHPMHSLFPQITVDTTAPLPGVVSDSLTSPHALSVPSDHCRHDRPSTWGGVRQPDITPCTLCSLRSL